MKKLFLITLALLLVLSLVACDNGAETSDNDTTTEAPETTNPEETTPEDTQTTEPETTETTEPESTESTEPIFDPSVFVEVRETVYVYGTDELNVRASYSTDSEKVGTMKEGESVVRTGYNEKWSRISYFGETRYASSEYLTTTAPFTYTNKTETVYVTTASLNLRVKPYADATISYTLTQGTAITRTGESTTADEEGNYWSRLLYNGAVCYANSIYLSTVLNTSDTLVFEEKNDIVYIIAENLLNLREDASADATIVTSLGYGTALSRTGLSAADADGSVWCRVLYNGKTCYVNAKYVTTTPTVAFNEINETLRTTGDLNLRSVPNLSESTVLKTIPKGETVQAIGKATAPDNDEIIWYKVVYNGTTGYASGKYLESNASVPEA